MWRRGELCGTSCFSFPIPFRFLETVNVNGHTLISSAQPIILKSPFLWWLLWSLCSCVEYLFCFSFSRDEYDFVPLLEDPSNQDSLQYENHKVAIVKPAVHLLYWYSYRQLMKSCQLIYTSQTGSIQCILSFSVGLKKWLLYIVCDVSILETSKLLYWIWKTYIITILYYTILYYTILYYTILYYTILYCTVLYYIVLHYTILLYCTISTAMNSQASDCDMLKSLTRCVLMINAECMTAWNMRYVHIQDAGNLIYKLIRYCEDTSIWWV